MPPRCFVCGRDLHQVPDGEDLWSHFTLVQFGLDDAERALEQERDATGWTGHPTGAVWFCREHAGLAEARVGMHWRAALEAISAETGGRG